LWHLAVWHLRHHVQLSLIKKSSNHTICGLLDFLRIRVKLTEYIDRTDFVVHDRQQI